MMNENHHKHSVDRVLRLLAPLLVIVAGILLYAGTLNVPFTGDDVLVTLDAPQAFEPANIFRYFFHDFDWIQPEEMNNQQPSRFGLYRPLLMSSFIIDSLIWGHNPFGWRLTNLLLHLVASLMVLGLAARLTKSVVGGLCAALLFVVHPTHIEAVYGLLGGRAELLAFVFVTGSWWVFASGENRSSGSRWRRDILSAILFLLGLWSKENAGMVPAILFLWSWAVCRQSAKNILVRLIPHLIVFAVYVVVRLTIIGRLAPNDWSSAFGANDAAVVLPTIMVVFFKYLYLTVFPYPLQHPDCFNGLADHVSWGEGLLAGILILGSMAVALYRLVQGRRLRLVRWGSFCVLLFYLCLVPVSHIIPFKVLMGFRFLYLPSLAFCLLIGHLIGSVTFPRRWLIPGMAALLITLYGAWTLTTNLKWKDLDTFYGTLIECNPDSADAYNNMGTYQMRQSRLNEALWNFDKAVSLSPSYTRPLFNKALTLKKMGREEEAMEIYRQILTIDPNHSRTLTNLGILLFQQGDVDGARKVFERVIRQDPRHPAAFVNLGNVLQHQGEQAEAERMFRIAIRMAPRAVEPRFNLGRLLEKTNKKEEAQQVYRDLISIEPGHVMAYNNLANLLVEEGKPEEAQPLFQEALRIDPKCWQAQVGLGLVLQSKSQFEAAAHHFDNARKIRPEDIEILLLLADSYRKQGDISQAKTTMESAARISPQHPKLLEMQQWLQTVQSPAH